MRLALTIVLALILGALIGWGVATMHGKIRCVGCCSSDSTSSCFPYEGDGGKELAAPDFVFTPPGE